MLSFCTVSLDFRSHLSFHHMFSLYSEHLGFQDLELRRKVIVLLAFLGSSGNSGFQIVMNHKLGNGANFLMLILQALVLELDVEAAGRCESLEVSKERYLEMHFL